ncbi:MAG: glycosyltransferase family 2 protein [Ignavibacteria bacterium]|nr:glycosyltransferase family 2 protein [Ignavibacteria bacterium]
MISVIIVQYNNQHLTKQAITSFIEHCKLNYEIILVDNGSESKNESNELKDFPNLNLIQLEKNRGFGFANNRGAEVANGEILLFLNNDTITISPFTEKVFEIFQKDDSIGVVGPKLLNEDRTLQLSWGNYPNLLNEFFTKLTYKSFHSNNKFVQNIIVRKYSSSRFVDFVTGAAMFVRRELFQRVNGFDENMFMYFEDADLCKKITKLGKKVLFYPEVELVHIRGASFNDSTAKFIKHYYRKSQLMYYEKHNSLIELTLLKLYLKATNKYPNDL